MRSRTACTSGTTSTPSTRIRSFSGARKATCSAARCSVTLIFSPLNMASMRRARPQSSARRMQQSDRLVGDPMLRVVEVEPGGFGRHALAAPGVAGEELPQMQIAHLPGSAAPAPSTPDDAVSGPAGAVSHVGHHRATPGDVDCLQLRRSWRRCSPAGPATTCRRLRFPRAGAGSRAPHRPRRCSREFGEHLFGIAAIDRHDTRSPGRGRRRRAGSCRGWC